MSIQPVTKAIFPVAGLGTRFLPATKANPKEMLPIVDKPLIQYAVEEAIAAGIQQLIFVTSSTKRAIEDHFDANFELEQRLREQQKWDLLDIVQNIVPEGVDCIYVRQAHALGLGHAVRCAKQVVGQEPFAVLLADDLIDAPVGCLTQMQAVYESTGHSVIAVQTISREDTEKYGIVSLEGSWDRWGAITNIVEKPLPAEAPSTLGVVGRYILRPEIFECLDNQLPDKKGEIQLTDAIAHLLGQQVVYAHQFDGKRYDCGSKLGYMQANVALGLRHPEWGKEFQYYLQQTVRDYTEK